MAERPESSASPGAVPTGRNPPSLSPPSLSPLGEAARRADPDRFLCALFAPPAKREPLFGLIAFNHELARAREVASNPMLALIRLQWWRDAVAEAAAGGGRRHEVAGPVGGWIRDGTLDAADLDAMIDAREAEADEAIPSREAFAAYLRGTSGGLAVASGRLLGASGGALAGLQALGAAYGLAGVLRSVAALAGQGRCLLPADALAEHGTTTEAVLRDPHAAPVAATIRDLAALGGGWLDQGRAAGIPRFAIAAALPGVLARRDLARLRRVAAGRVATGIARRGIADRLAVTAHGLRGKV
ncbi:squalene/phytoene synthase family protein [Roseomonas sp. NAR14]|uniref:Squalene/phytoene synthase family protein n=1 Tax=Roseomonas acroporae TaxID=2937791 RepID=A0A9X1YC21_9PROT|nr:squalene/phytoene synthase family protein [Roseomonas acroporae]MCK8783766.1 squalene/phytoene synthase family protein [Roseomonas acroporae]